MTVSPGLHVLGLDGGGSHTVCLIVDGQGREVGAAESGPCNHQLVGVAKAQSALREAIRNALRSAGRPALAAACLGMAGLDREEDLRLVREMAGAVLPGVSVEIAHDSDIALAAGTRGRRVGVVLLAGTGSIAVGVDSAGRRVRAGGWGHILGDEGSGYDIARRALNAATRSIDGRTPSNLLRERLVAAAGVASFEDLANRIYLGGWTPGQVAALAPAVMAAADDGEAVALEILMVAAHELALAVRVVVLSLGMQEQGFDLILSGGILAGSPRVVELVRREIASFAPRAAIALPGHPPAYGAALIALQAVRAASSPALPPQEIA